MQGVFPGGFPGAAGGQNQPPAVVGAAQLGRHDEDPLAQGLERGGLKLGR
jgi:hypothetical protein